MKQNRINKFLNGLLSRCVLMITMSCLVPTVYSLPRNFVYLEQVDPTIFQEIRYAGHHNFVGRPIDGYERAVCIVTAPTAIALKKVQTELLNQGYSLKVYDCYRPVSAVEDFMGWSQDRTNEKMKDEFYPNIAKQSLFKFGYIASKSGHSRGSTVDLTIVKIHNRKAFPTRNLIIHSDSQGSVVMGSSFDFMDKISHLNSRKISREAKANRRFLQYLMRKAGFIPYQKEWWHFTLKKEPFPSKYFNFPVR